jgi:hypothetical protein
MARSDRDSYDDDPKPKKKRPRREDDTSDEPAPKKGGSGMWIALRGGCAVLVPRAPTASMWPCARSVNRESTQSLKR